MSKKRKRTSSINESPAKRPRKSSKCDKKLVKKRRKPLKKNEKPRKKYYKRPRMRCIRWQLAKAIEKALAEAPGIPLIYHLFDTQDSMGTPQARLSHVLRQMRISNFVKNVHKMKDTYWKSLSQFTTMFTIENEEDDGSLFLKFTPIFDKKAATIYVDNLPEGCNEEKLMRLAKCYGNVAHLKIARKTPRMVRPRYFPARKKQNPKVKTLPPKNRHFHRNPPKKKKLIDVGSRPLSYGFIRFCDPESARKMIEAFTLNDPSIPFENHETQIRRQNEELAVEMLEFGPGDPENPENSNAHRQFYLFQRPFSELAMTKLIREIEFLKRRRRRRSWPMFHRLEVLRRRLRGLRTRELQCRVKAGLMRPFYRRKGKRQRKQEKQLRLEQKQRLEEEEQARADALAEEQERLDNLLILAMQNPSTSSSEHPLENHQLPSTSSTVETLLPESNGDLIKKKKKHNNRKKKKNKKKEKKEDGKIKKKKRKRKKKCRKLADYISGGVHRFFRDLQVISLDKYQKLKEEYKGLQQEALRKVEEERENQMDQLPDLDV